MIDISTLNPQQRDAVVTTEGPLLVLAGAGSGKTRVITHRIAWLLAQGVPAERILAVSFTNKAAGEMQERIVQLVGPAGRTVLASTFHALGLRFIRQEYEAAGLSKTFTILDEGDQLAAVRDCLTACGYDTTKFDPKAVLARISHYKNLLMSPAPEASDFDQVVGRVMPLYKRRLRAMSAVDFDDLIGLPVTLLETSEEIALRWAWRFRYIMVDEFQDTNGAQLRFIKALGRGSGNVCVVGDDDQSIYAWRGAVAGNILRFDEHFPGAKSIFLTQNYRSTNCILRCANHVIANNVERHVKELWSENGDGEMVRYKLCENDEEESHWIATDLLLQRNARKLPWSSFAVLYRTNVQARTVEDAMRVADIPYRIVGGSRFYDRKEVRDVVAYMRLVVNPKDEAALRRVINYPARGVGDSSIERIHEQARASATPFNDLALNHPDEVQGLRPKTVKALIDLRGRLARYRGWFDSMSMAEASRAMIQDLNFANEIFRRIRETRVARKKLDNVEEVPSALAAFSKRVPDAELPDYLARLSLDSRSEEDGDEQRDEVCLMTLHSSKGLEFDSVYLAGVEEGLMPHQRTLDGDGEIAEERRLAYVGITRARKLLTLSGAKIRLRFGRVQRRKRSRFLKEIPEHLIDGGHYGDPEERSEEEQREHAKAAFDAMSALFDEL
ncbi:MAG: ATP-dependent helicase [Bradymonadia bacterium]